jgi:hypothetical protein
MVATPTVPTTAHVTCLMHLRTAVHPGHRPPCGPVPCSNTSSTSHDAVLAAASIPRHCPAAPYRCRHRLRHPARHAEVEAAAKGRPPRLAAARALQLLLHRPNARLQVVRGLVSAVEHRVGHKGCGEATLQQAGGHAVELWRSVAAGGVEGWQQEGLRGGSSSCMAAHADTSGGQQAGCMREEGAAWAC